MTFSQPSYRTHLPTPDIPPLRIQDIFDHIPAMIGYWDANQHNIFANQAYSSWLGMTPEQVRGKSLRLVLGEELYRLNQPYIAAVLRGEPQKFERAIPAPDGSQIRYALAEYLPDQVKGVVRGFYAHVTDISHLKQAEGSLRAKDELLQGLYQLAPLGIGLNDMDGRFIEVNAAFCEIVGYNVEELKLLDYWQLTPSEYIEYEKIQLEEFIRTGRYGPYEKEFIRKDGSLIPVRLNGMMVTGTQGQKFIWSLIEDISDQKVAELQLLGAKEAAEEASHAKSAFLNTISHELRTPMNGILGMAQLLQLTNLTSEQSTYAETLLDVGQHLLDLINQMIEFSAAEAGKVALCKSNFSPYALLHESAGLCANEIQTKGLKLKVFWHGQPDERYIADQKRLLQILIYLIKNAIKFTEQGHIYIEAQKIEHEEKPSYLQFSVSDSGIGIPAIKRGVIFQAFTQVDNSNTRKFGGMGLSLSIAKSLVEHMGGSIGFESEVDQGSRFWFTIPAERPEYLSQAGNGMNS